MASLFWRQFGILLWKNWIVLSKHPFLNILRCFLLPVAYGIFLAVAQLFLIKPNNNGLGTTVPVPSLRDQYDGSFSLIWSDATNGPSSPSPSQIIEHISSGFNHAQLRGLKQVANARDIPEQCPQNFNLFSECYAALVFNSIPENSSDVNPINYTIRADAGLFHIDVERHNSDYEARILPLQWAVDQAIIELKTGVQIPTPLEWPFTQATNEEQSRDIRLSYIRGLRTLLVIALFICYVGIIYQLPGAVASERAAALTSHMKAMGLMDSARTISWIVSISLAYLPAWIIVGLTWHYRIFTVSNAGLILVIHLLLGFSLAGWSLFIAAPFGKSPQLAAVVSTFLGILLAIVALVFQRASSVAAFIYSIIFPPGFYIFAIRAICGFENHLQPTNLLRPDPDTHLSLLPLIIAAIIDILLWPWLAVLLERRLYDPHEPNVTGWACWRKRSRLEGRSIPPETAISISSLNKTFSTSLLGRKKGLVTAVDDLTFDIPKYGIFVLLGSNGAGKSTCLSIIGGLAGRTSGLITFEDGLSRPPRGTLGIVPQKNVLFDELTCFQTLKLWRAIKRADLSSEDEDIAQLLRDCDLESKIHASSSTLSGGQKRKLQLAIGLVGNSQIVLVDECTSGVDPLSRRALWRTLSSYRNERTIVFTTHFLDEADLLADHIAILAAPGKLVAKGTPVSLKRELGEGYTIQVSFSSAPQEKDSAPNLFGDIQTIVPGVYAVVVSPSQVAYHLKSRDPKAVVQVLRLLDSTKSQYHILSYDILGTTVEDIFLELMATESEKHSFDTAISNTSPPKALKLDNGRQISPLQQACTIVYKRALVARRSWLSPLLCVLVAIAGSAIPLVFLTDRTQTCTRKFRNAPITQLYLPTSPNLTLFGFVDETRVQTSPPGIASTLGNTTRSFPVNNLLDNASFVNDIERNYRNLSVGGVSINLSSSSSLVAWEASSPGINGPIMLNLASNILYNGALNTSGRAATAPDLIMANYQPFPAVSAGTLVALKWVAFFGAAMSVFTAFFSLYVSRERRAAVQAMQFSNGLTNPIGLWIGHLAFDSLFTLVIATVIIIIFATVSDQFHGLGFFWFILVLYGIAGALFSYVVSLFTPSPLAAFAAVAGYQIIMFLLYLAGYLLTLTYAKTSEAGNIITILHYTLSLLSPVASVIRAALVSVNLFSLLCDGTNQVTSSSMGAMNRYGGPILYLIIYALILLAILVWVDSGSLLRRARRRVTPNSTQVRPSEPDVAAEEHASSTSFDLLRVQHISKTFGKNKVVDNVSFGATRDTIFALLGPNGAGKTTTFNVIRGDIWPDTGDVLIDGVSVISHPQKARLSLGVCPQFTAIDSQLTVREHLEVYGRLKGLQPDEIRRSVDSLLAATGLGQYADRLASKISGGNQRKVSLSVALIGNPSVILIDEFSTGIDAKMKRDMWGTLRNVALGKAVIITTHSMEEASALANKVGIVAKRMLAVGTTDTLSDRYASYEVHFSCHTPEDVGRAQRLMSHIPGAKLAEDVSTRFEVPMDLSKGISLEQLFSTLAEHGDFTEYTVEKATLESVFLKVIRENNIREEEQGEPAGRRWWNRS